MTIDLESSLADLARSVHDDAVADRMNGQVRHMVTRIRRRRAARYSATGVVGLGATAAVAVGGLQLADRSPAPVPPAATDPTSAPVPAMGCGQPSSDLPATSDATFDLFGEAGPTAPYGEPVPVALTLASANAQTYTVGETLQVVVLEDGVVVGTAEGDASDLGVEAGIDPQEGAAITVIGCDGDNPLSTGEYQLVALATVELFDGTSRTVVSDPLPFAITDAEPVEASTAEEALADTLARAPVDEAFPVCGSAVPTQVDPPVVIDLVLGERVYAPGEVFTTEVTVRSTADRNVLANAPSPLARIVLTRDGIVVGQVIHEPVDSNLITVAPDEPLTVPADAQLSVCRIGFVDYPPFALPAGTYQAYAVAEMWLKEIQTPDDAYSLNELFAAMSEPVDVTIG